MWAQNFVTPGHMTLVYIPCTERVLLSPLQCFEAMFLHQVGQERGEIQVK